MPLAFMRPGSVRMMAARWTSSRRPHCAISGKVRPQPRQMSARPSTMQTLMQGVSAVTVDIPDFAAHNGVGRRHGHKP